MYSLRLKVNNSIYLEVLELLSKFRKEDIEVIEENMHYISIKEYLENELKQIQTGKAKYVSTDELNTYLEERIAKYENNNH